MKEILHLKRVSYGKSGTPIDMREYTVEEFPTSAVGTIKEIKEFAEKHKLNIESFVLKDKTQPVSEVVIHFKKKLKEVVE
jgi:hypothetical protein